MSPEWRRVKLSDCCSIDKQKYKNENLPYVGMEDITSDIGKFTGSLSPKKVGSSTFIFSGKHVLYGRLRPYLNKAFLPEFEGHCSSEIFPLSPKPDLDRGYLFYWITSKPVVEKINKTCTGTRMPRANVKEVFSFELLLPLIKEQKRIVAILDQAFEGIDKAIANTEKNLTNARELFESYLNNTFTQKGEGDKTLKQVSVDFGRGKSKHRPRNDPKLYGGAYPFIQTGDVRNCEHLILSSSQSYNEAGLAQSKLWPKGTICITIAANIAETGILNFDACFPDSIIGIVVDGKQTSNDFVEYLLQSVKARIKARGKGSAQDNINLATFKNELFSFPNLDEQHHIVERLHTLSVETGRLEDIYRKKLTSLAELKQSLLQKAFSGELTSDNSVVVFPVSKTAKNAGSLTPEFTAKVLAFAYHRHAAKNCHNTFGHVKAQKTLHLVESISGVELGRKPIKDAAGPNDFQHMLNAEAWAKENQFFEFVSRGEDKGYDFKKLLRYDELMAGVFATIKPYQVRVERVVDLIMPEKSRETELIATVYAAWNNLILDGCKITDKAILWEARENWHADKMKIPVAEFQQAIRFIRDKGIIPDGKAKRVTGQDSLFLNE